MSRDRVDLSRAIRRPRASAPTSPRPCGLAHRTACLIVQEIFGVNAHIRSVADGWARDGFLAVAPALFDRISPGIELGYDGPICKPR